NDVKNAVGVVPTSKQFRLAGLVIDAQHRLTKAGKNFGVLHVEDFSGKAEFMLWSEDYVKYTQYMEKGTIIMIEGAFKQRYNGDTYEFKIAKLHLLETAKSSLTKQVIIDVPPQFIDEDFVTFIDKNVQSYPGKTMLKFNISDTLLNSKVSMYTLEKGFTMNDEMAIFLNENKNIDVSVLTV
ncbi:MAG: OB-fold nucleic acid binding domain-containing protein, partial [Ferruginibacter sp.]